VRAAADSAVARRDSSVMTRPAADSQRSGSATKGGERDSAIQPRFEIDEKTGKVRPLKKGRGTSGER